MTDNKGVDFMLTDRMDKAIQTAAVYHQNQYRKNPERKIPYVSHPYAVGLMLMRLGYPEDVIVAGLLHDTVEDTTLKLDEIRKEFGDRVADLVVETSEADKTLPWEERKKRYIEHLRTASREAKAISCCDKLHNMRSMISSLKAGGNIWGNLKRGKADQLARFHQMLGIFKESLEEDLVREYDAALKELEKL
jgi:(p)ppGpp synthase/HD superfamily hydrolase